MHTLYLKEMSSFAFGELKADLHLNHDETCIMVEKLLTSGIVVNSSNTVNRGESAGSIKRYSNTYQVVFVGVALVDDYVLVCYPKYLEEPDDVFRSMKKIMRAFRRYEQECYLVGFDPDTASVSGDLAIMLALFDLHDAYGLYSNRIRSTVKNGLGEINWERTIGKHVPFLSRGVPVYFDVENSINLVNESDYVTRLHRCVLTKCSQRLSECGLLDLLCLEELQLSDEEIDDFGDEKTIEHLLFRELASQFVTWKREVIELLLGYLGLADLTTDRKGTVSLLGTNSFHCVWERACKVALDDCISLPIGRSVEVAASWRERADSTFLEIIPRPIWLYGVGGESVALCEAGGTLIPDIVTIWSMDRKNDSFGIFDAKYYTPRFGKRVYDAPGVESVSKQFLYQSALKPFIEAHDFIHVTNAFVFPAEGMAIEKIGRVEFSAIPLENVPLTNHIDLFMLPAEVVFESYLNGTPLKDDAFFGLFH